NKGKEKLIVYFGSTMLNHIGIEQILFLDIETVPACYKFSDLSDSLKELWAQKTRYSQERDNLTPEEIYEKAGIFAEFGKVVCISTAVEYKKEGVSKLRVKSYYGDDEKALLSAFGTMLIKHFKGDDKF